jgi:hypothetical protein
MKTETVLKASKGELFERTTLSALQLQLPIFWTYFFRAVLVYKGESFACKRI